MPLDAYGNSPSFPIDYHEISRGRDDPFETPEERAARERRTEEARKRNRLREMQENREEYDHQMDNYTEGLQEFTDNLLPALEAICDSCCPTSEKCEENGSPCDKEKCKEDAVLIATAIRESWVVHWGQPNNNIPNFPHDPNENAQHIGGYFCYDWVRIFYNAANSVNSDCFTLNEEFYFYQGFGDDAAVGNGFLVHAYLEIFAYQETDECKVMLTMVFLLMVLCIRILGR